MPGRFYTADKEKLVQCWMENPKGEGRYRFVEMENFRLWEYLVTTKHGMTVTAPTICLWISDNHFQRNQALFRHSGEVSGVDRVMIERYDPNYKFCNLIHRYCLTQETKDLMALLKKHITEQGADSGDWEMSVTQGWGIEPNAGELLEPVALGIA